MHHVIRVKIRLMFCCCLFVKIDVVTKLRNEASERKERLSLDRSPACKPFVPVTRITIKILLMTSVSARRISR